jgi:hypothetical protein
MRQSNVLRSIALVVGSGLLVTAGSAVAAPIPVDGSVLLKFRADGVSLVQRAANSAGITIPPVYLSTNPNVTVSVLSGTIDPVASSFSLNLAGGPITASFRGVSVTGSDCKIISVNASSAFLSCLVKVMPGLPLTRVPLIKFSGDNFRALIGVFGHGGGPSNIQASPASATEISTAMVVPQELIDAIKLATGRSYPYGGAPLGTATGSMRDLN